MEDPKLTRFIAQFKNEGPFGCKPGLRAEDGKRVTATGECIDTGTERNPACVLTEEVMDTIEWTERDKAEPYVTALLDATGDDGLLEDSLEEVSRIYSDIVDDQLEVEALEYWRTHIMEHGPVLGLAAFTEREFRYCVAAQVQERKEVACSYFQARVLKIFRKKLAAKSVAVGTDLGELLMKLAEKVHLSTKQPRKLTPGVVKKQIGCDVFLAAMLAELYEGLPRTPMKF